MSKQKHKIMPQWASLFKAEIVSKHQGMGELSGAISRDMNQLNMRKGRGACACSCRGAAVPAALYHLPTLNSLLRAIITIY